MFVPKDADFGSSRNQADGRSAADMPFVWKRWRTIGFLLVMSLCLVTGVAMMASAAFNWRAYSGTEIRLLMVKHPFTDTMVERLDDFQALTGIKVSYDTVPEEQFFDKLTTVLLSGSAEYDAFMVGAYMIWQYSPPKWLEPLDSYISDPTKTSPDYDFKDILPVLITDQRWDMVDGHPTGTGSLWALPWGFHTSNIVYRRDVFQKYGLTPPRDLEELYALGKKLKQLTPNMIPLVVRGTRSWASIHASVMSWFTSYGGKDFTVDSKGRLRSALADNPEGIAAHEVWGKILRETAEPNYSDYTWYDVSNAFSNGQAAMFYDADIIGYFNHLTSPFASEFALAPPPGKPGGANTANMWIWSIAMNANSRNKDAAWYWMQYVTSKDYVLDAAVNGLMVDPIRRSTWDDPRWAKKISSFTNYLETFNKVWPQTRIYFTPQRGFFEATTEWSAALQRIHSGIAAKTALEEAARKINRGLR